MRTVSRVAPAAAAARAPSLGARRALGANRSAPAVRRHRPARRDGGASARRVVVATRAFFSSDESGSLDDYEFDAGVREAYRTRRAFERAEWHAQEPREKAKELLARVDAAGVWTIATTAFVIGISVSESLFDGGAGGAGADPIALSTLLPAWVPDAVASRTGYIDPATVASGEETVQAIFLFEFVLRAWSEEFSVKYLRSPVALVDFAAVLPTLVGGSLGGSGALRTFRLFRLLRLLRLADDVNAGLKDRSDEDGDDKIFGKVTSVAVEFLCVFLIAGEIFYDLEYETNPDISDVGDALYWSFLTLTGIGQPFDAVTAQGRVATVLFILTALVVVPLQLSTLVAATNKQREKEKKQRRARGKERRARVRSKVGGVAPVISVDMSRSFDSSGSFDDIPVDSGAGVGVGLSGASSFLDQSVGFETIDESYDSFDENSPPNLSEDGMQREVADLRRRVRSFEKEVDALRAENARLRAENARNRMERASRDVSPKPLADEIS